MNNVEISNSSKSQSKIMTAESIVVSGLGVKIPGIDDLFDSLFDFDMSREAKPFVHTKKIANYGLRYKDTATKLALFAAQEALLNSNLLSESGDCIEGETCAVVVSSNMGNFDTVCNVVDTVRNEGANAVSVMDVPNASSNVIASSLAIKYQIKGVNLMLCNGATSGVDALHIASNLIKAGRATRALVVGVEPANHVTEKLWKESLDVRSNNGDTNTHNVAAAVVLESRKNAISRKVKPLCELGVYSFCNKDSISDAIYNFHQKAAQSFDFWFCPQEFSKLNIYSKINQDNVFDIGRVFKGIYGAQGVMQAVIGCDWLRNNKAKSLLITNGEYFEQYVSSLSLKSVNDD